MTHPGQSGSVRSPGKALQSLAVFGHAFSAESEFSANCALTGPRSPFAIFECPNFRKKGMCSGGPIQVYPRDTLPVLSRAATCFCRMKRHRFRKRLWSCGRTPGFSSLLPIYVGRHASCRCSAERRHDLAVSRFRERLESFRAYIAECPELQRNRAAMASSGASYTAMKSYSPIVRKNDLNSPPMSFSRRLAVSRRRGKS